MGGIRPPDRRRGSSALSLSERKGISRGLSIKQSLRAIARQLQRARLTISREVRRNGGSVGYRASGSDQAAWNRKDMQVGLSPDIGPRSIIKATAQIVARAGCGLAQTGVPRGDAQTGFTKTIYRSLYIEARGVLKKELLAHLRAKRTVRRSQQFADCQCTQCGQISLVQVRLLPPQKISTFAASRIRRDRRCHQDGHLVGVKLSRARSPVHHR